MKLTSTLILLVAFSLGLFAQKFSYPIDFETEDQIADFEQFDNGDPIDADNFVIADNPSQDEGNYTPKCIMFTIDPAGKGWAGAFSDEFGGIEITNDNYIIQVNVYRENLKNFLLKLEDSQDANNYAQVDVMAENVEEWELLSFDFSSAKGKIFDRLVLIPDHVDARTEGTVVYIDQIGFEGTINLGDSSMIKTSINKKSASALKIYPNPANNFITIQQSEMSKITISNAIGQNVKVLELSGINSQTIDLSNLSSGIYFATIESVKGIESKKILVQ